jgi:hypothetical protein
LLGYAQPTISPAASSASQQSRAGSVCGAVSASRTSSAVKSGSPTAAMSLAWASRRISGTSSSAGRRMRQPSGNSVTWKSEHKARQPGQGFTGSPGEFAI